MTSIPPPSTDALPGSEGGGWRVAAIVALWALLLCQLAFTVIGLLGFGLGGGSGPDRELAIIAEVPTYAGAEMAFEHEYSSGACSGYLDVMATADDVVEHYRIELERDGWTVAIDDVPTGSPEGEPVDTRELRAVRDGAEFTVALESWSGRTSAAIRVEA
jgi:hypothetical protein